MNKTFWILVIFELILLGLFFGQILVANGFQLAPIFNLMLVKNSIPYTLMSWIRAVTSHFLNFYTPLLGIPGGLYFIYLFKKYIKNKLLLWEKTVMIFSLVCLIHIVLWRIGSYHLPYWQIYFLPAVIITATYLILTLENYIFRRFKPGMAIVPFKIAYYLLIFYIIVTESQPLVRELYTKGGRYLFPHFYINGFL